MVGSVYVEAGGCAGMGKEGVGWGDISARRKGVKDTWKEDVSAEMDVKRSVRMNSPSKAHQYTNQDRTEVTVGSHSQYAEARAKIELSLSKLCWSLDPLDGSNAPETGHVDWLRGNCH
jgi:hypothetical protein